MRDRKTVLLCLLAGCAFGVTLLWALQDSRRPAGATLVAASETEAPSTRDVRKERETRSSEPESTLSDLARERERVEQLEESSALPKKLAASWRSRSDARGEFDSGALEASGFSPDDIGWFRERWEQAERERSYLADLEARGEDPPPGRGYSDIERELREDLRESGYDAMLYATNQDNRVSLMRVRDGSVASRAGLRDGSVVWSYDGQRVFRPDELARLSTTGARGERVEIVIVTRDGTESIYVERNPLGAELVSAKAQPHPD